MRSDVNDELAELRAKVDQLSLPIDRPSNDDKKAKNIILRGLPFSENENITAKVQNIINDGLHLQGIVCDSAERKDSRDARPGVVVVRFRTVDDKRKVMSKKRDLKNSRQYASIFIEHDMSYADRDMSNNLRTLLRSMKDQNLSMRGSRVVPRDDTGSSRFAKTAPHTLGRVVLTAVRGRTETAKVFVVTVALSVAMTCVVVDKAWVWAAAASVDAAVVVMGRGTMADRGVVVAVHETVDPAGATTTTNVIITGEITLAIRFQPGSGSWVE